MIDKAAVVLILVDDQVLAFRRLDGGVGLPGGKVEPGETPQEAAVREVKEETGYDIVVLDYPPYVCNDIESNFFVFCFMGRISGGDMIDQCPGEGVPLWTSLLEVLVGPYGFYNMNALKHFQVHVKLF